MTQGCVKLTVKANKNDIDLKFIFLSLNILLIYLCLENATIELFKLN